MSVRVNYEIQENGDNLNPRPVRRHEWQNIGGRDGKVYLSEDDFIFVGRIPTAARAWELVRQLREHYASEWLKAPSMRVVKVTTTVEYDVIVAE